MRESFSGSTMSVGDFVTPGDPLFPIASLHRRYLARSFRLRISEMATPRHEEEIKKRSRRLFDDRPGTNARSGETFSSFAYSDSLYVPP